MVFHFISGLEVTLSILRAQQWDCMYKAEVSGCMQRGEGKQARGDRPAGGQLAGDPPLSLASHLVPL